MLEVAKSFNEIYDEVKDINEGVESINSAVHDFALSIFSDAFNSLESCNMEITDQVVSAQQVSDIILKKATVVGFNGAEYSMFAQNYAIANGIYVSEILEFSDKNISEDSINAVISNAKRELNVK